MKKTCFERRRKRATTILYPNSTAWQDELPIIGDVRGKALLVGVELVRDPETREPAREESAAVAFQECFKRGLLAMRAGLSTIKFCPPLTVRSEQIDRALQIFEESLRAIGGAGRN